MTTATINVVIFAAEIIGIYITIFAMPTKAFNRALLTAVVLLIIWVFYKPIISVIADTSIVYIIITTFATIGLFFICARNFPSRKSIRSFFKDNDLDSLNPLPKIDFVMIFLCLFVPWIMMILPLHELNIDEYVLLVNQSTVNLERARIIWQYARISIYCIGKLLGIVILLVNTLKYSRTALMLYSRTLDVADLPLPKFKGLCVSAAPVFLCSDYFILLYDKICSII